jgi:excisionase family DNA binding protein
MPTLPTIPLADDDRWMTKEEVSSLLGVSVETIRRWVRQGKLPSYAASVTRYFKKSDINKLLKSKGLPTI